MARIAGVNIPTAKKIEVALTYILVSEEKLPKIFVQNRVLTATAAFRI